MNMKIIGFIKNIYGIYNGSPTNNEQYKKVNYYIIIRNCDGNIEYLSKYDCSEIRCEKINNLNRNKKDNIKIKEAI